MTQRVEIRSGSAGPLSRGRERRGVQGREERSLWLCVGMGLTLHAQQDIGPAAVHIRSGTLSAQGFFFFFFLPHFVASQVTQW